MSGPDLDLFTAPLPDHLHCPVCLGAAYPPVVVCSSEHIICHACLLDMIRKGVAKHCPTCRELMPASLKVSPGFKRAVESYECVRSSLFLLLHSTKLTRATCAGTSARPGSASGPAASATSSSTF